MTGSGRRRRGVLVHRVFTSAGRLRLGWVRFRGDANPYGGARKWPAGSHRPLGDL
jgi:hypothetical protein